MSESRFMPSPIVGVGLVIVAVVLIAVGYTLSASCGGGYSLVLFGIAAALIGGTVALFGGVLVVPFAVVAALALIGAGLYLANMAGCAIWS